MRLAIFSDVHGNFHALQAVLADIDTNGPFDHILFAGDLVWGAAMPVECIAALRDRDIKGVYGNTDEFLWTQMNEPSVEWAREKIGSEGIEFLQTLPFERRISPTGKLEDDLLIVHANPKDVTAPIFPTEAMQLSMRGEIRQTDAQVEPLLENVSAKTIAFGHVHIPNIRMVKGYALANIASVSRPQDGDWRCKYGVFTFENGTWRIEHRRVEYDVRAAKEAILKSDFPDAEKAANLLQ